MSGGERIAVRFLVGGRVQGVGYRAATRREAQSLGLDGFARNLDDGRVEVVAEGDPQAIERLADFLQRGPAFAQVTRIDRDPIEVNGRAGFGVG